MRVLGVCSYKGTNYYGWQKQVGYVTIQSKIEEVLSQIYNTPISIIGSGRTDAGVHALRQYFHYDVDKEKDLKQLVYAMNKMLPDDIRILSLDMAYEEFHARYNAVRKVYEYDILRTNKDPFKYDEAWIYPMEFDVSLLRKALKLFIGVHNYQDFTSKEEDEKGFVREIYSVEIKVEGDLIRIVFIGSGFMRYQIRNMVGAAMSVANHKEDISFIEKHLDSTERDIISYKAPACGLYLAAVMYV